MALRASTIAFMQAHRDDFEPYLEDEEDWEHYCDRMARDGTWAGQQELVALARDQRVRLRVYQAGQPSWVLAPDFPEFPKDALDIHLSYHDGAHYNSVRRSDNFADGPLAPFGLLRATPAAKRAFGDREEERVAQEAGCFHDCAAVRAALEAAGEKGWAYG
ncbi:hypothetical protein WJX81_001182 [Elliptochloris bilobata]|uniref:OTU domain-containing protein n=1 Tax=Elliptochloris bilobata TaxID=381761 RepID=A0AAW1SCF3_9CHLO